jgi:fatty acid desaturase
MTNSDRLVLLAKLIAIGIGWYWIAVLMGVSIRSTLTHILYAIVCLIFWFAVSFSEAFLEAFTEMWSDRRRKRRNNTDSK